MGSTCSGPEAGLWLTHEGTAGLEGPPGAGQRALMGTEARGLGDGVVDV